MQIAPVKDRKPLKALTEQEIQEKLYGRKSNTGTQPSIHPQLVQARSQITELEEELQRSQNREIALRSHVTELERENTDLEKQISRLKKDREKLEHRIVQLGGATKPTARSQKTQKTQKLDEAIRTGISKIQNILPPRIKP
jgi:septal ring factor EnvC (AmiA/AmiB activator)